MLIESWILLVAIAIVGFLVLVGVFLGWWLGRVSALTEYIPMFFGLRSRKNKEARSRRRAEKLEVPADRKPQPDPDADDSPIARKKYGPEMLK